MNLREGTRRLALLLGVAGAIAGGFVSYLELQTTLEQWARHNEFEQLARSEVVQQERKVLQAQTDSQTGYVPAWTVDRSMVGTTAGDSLVRKPSGYVPTWAFEGIAVNKGGIKIIYWKDGWEVDSIDTMEGKLLSPTPAPGAGSYLLIAVLPFIGFFIPWGAVRAIGWVLAGFVHPSV